MLLELQLLDNLREEEADHIRCDRRLVPGSNLLGDTGPTDKMPLFED